MEGAKIWTITYTKHLTQRRKVYQDGFLEISNSNKKILLYDDCGKLLDSRLLKKDEVVQSGGTLQFEAHLVDVGDMDSNKRLNLDGLEREAKFAKKAATKGRSGGDLGDRNAAMHKLDDTKSVTLGTQNTVTEWHVLYTKQKVQKAKKFHDGFLRLTAGGHRSRQVVLLSEDETILESMHLRMLDNFSSGSTYEFANYLVEIGELRSPHGCTASACDFSKASEKETDNSSTTREKVAGNGKDTKTVPPSLCRVTREKVADNGKDTKASKPFRTACQILFDLKKPSATIPVDNVPSTEQTPHMDTLLLVQSDLTMRAQVGEVPNKMNLDDNEIQDYKCGSASDAAKINDQSLLANDALSFSDLVECDLRIRERVFSDISAAGVDLLTREPFDTSNSMVTFEGNASVKDIKGSSDGIHFFANDTGAYFNQLSWENNLNADVRQGSGLLNSVTTHGVAGSGLPFVELESPECNPTLESTHVSECPSFDLGI